MTTKLKVHHLSARGTCAVCKKNLEWPVRMVWGVKFRRPTSAVCEVSGCDSILAEIGHAQ